MKLVITKVKRFDVNKIEDDSAIAANTAPRLPSPDDFQLGTSGFKHIDVLLLI